jgi:hypothetical protein
MEITGDGSELFAEWLVKQGYEVVKSPSSYWVQVACRVYLSFPYHRVIDPSESEISQLLADRKAVALRYSTPVNAKFGQMSYHVVWADRPMEIEALPKKVRYDIRKGLAYANVEPVPFARMAEESWRLREETLARQGRTGAEVKKWWETLCWSAEGLPGLEAWGAFRDGKMVASLIAFATKGCSSILYQQSLTDSLNQGVNNALAFAFSRDVLSRPGIKSIFYGLHSLDAPPSVDDFKFRMGFVPMPVRQRVVFDQKYEPFAGRASHAALRAMHWLVPANWTFAKAEGTLRFYLQGRLALEKQAWPSCLAESKEGILTSLSRAYEVPDDTLPTEMKRAHRLLIEGAEQLPPARKRDETPQERVKERKGILERVGWGSRS